MIQIFYGSILRAKTDCIVNPANSHLRHGGGLARAIQDAAVRPETRNDHTTPPSPAEQRWLEDHQTAPLIPTGGAYATSAGMLPFKGVIHAVGPVWGDGYFHEVELLTSAYARSLRVARDNGWESIAFPAISAGIFGVPIETVAWCAQRAIWSMKLAHEQVGFYLMEKEHIDAFCTAFSYNPRDVIAVDRCAGVTFDSCPERAILKEDQDGD